MKKTLLIFLLLLNIISCNNKPKLDDKDNGLRINKCLSRTYFRYFDLFLDYPKIKDSTIFVENLILPNASGSEPKADSRITFFKKVNIYGSSKPIYIVEGSWGEGCMADYPWKIQVFFDWKGKFIGSESADSFAMVNVLKNQYPLLMMLVTTGKGFGWHCFYKYDKDSCKLVDMLVGDDHGDSQNMTYCSNDWYEINVPYSLNLLIKDYNNDGYNDIIFYGKCLVLYDEKTGEHYTTEKPFDKFDVEYVFLYNKEKDQFVLKN